MSDSAPLVSLQNLSFRLPDGRFLFEGISQSFEGARYGLVGRNGVGKTSLFELIAGRQNPASGAINVGGKLTYMQQNPDVTHQATIANQFGVSEQWALLTKASNGQATADELAQSDWQLESDISSVLNKVGLETLGLNQRISSLSGGQQTKAAFAAALFQQPDILLLDEPTNNLDRSGRDFVIDFLTRFQGLSITISHDRELLETMDKIGELSAQGLRIYGGNWSFFSEQKALETDAAERSLKSASASLDQIKRKAETFKERKQKKDAAGRRQNKRGVNAKVLMNAQAERAENSSGKGSKLTADRQSQASERVETAAAQVERLKALIIDLPPSGLAAGKQILKLDDVTIAYDHSSPIIEGLSVSIVGRERLAIIGPNGSGKSTLLKAISGQLSIAQGAIQVVDRMTMLDQHFSLLAQDRSLLDNFLTINPESSPNDAYSALARFEFRNEAARKRVNELSGGEALRAGLACILCSSAPPYLLILDEPTNHLDIASIETMEAALRGYDGALIVVSHDQNFLNVINITRTLEL